MNLMGGQARRLELIAGSLPAVKLPMTLALALTEPARELVVRKSRRGKPLGDVFPYFVRGRGDAGPDGGHEILRSRVELAGERVDRAPRHARRQAPPSGVRRGNRAAS